MIDSEVTATLVGQALNNDKFLSRYARIGNTDGFIKKAWSFLRSMVKELKSKGEENNELADIIMPTIRSMDRMLQSENAGESKSGKRYALDGTPDRIAEWEKPITVNDVSPLWQMSDKSINKLSSNEIKIAQKWAYKFYKELGVKSPFFRAWFGEWRAHDTKKVDIAHIETINIAQASLTYGDYTIDDTGWIVHAGNTLNGETRHHSGGSRINVKSLNSIETILKNSVLLDTIVSNPNRGRKSPNTAFLHKLYAVVEYNGQKYIAKTTVEEFYNDAVNGISQKAYELKAIKIELAGGQFGINPTSSRPVTSSTISISDLYDFVKSFDKDFSPAPEVSKYVLNEDGTPKVFYHGTRNNFTTFELQDKPQYGRALGDGFYFTSSYDKAFKFANGLFSKGQDRGGIIMPVYLQMQNPYIIEADADRTKWANEYHKGNYDGIIDLKNDTYYVEGQTQIKSATDNIGTFDKTNPDIRYSLAPKKSQTNAKEAASEKKYSLAVKGESETKTEITGKYSYDSLIRKNPLVFAEFEEDFPKLSDQKTMDRNKIVEAARENARLQNNPNNTSYATYVYVSSIDKDVLIGKQGLTHGLSHGATETALATMKIGELLKNSIAVNELNARTTNKSSTDMSYVLIAVGKNKTDSFIVRMVVDKTTSEVTQISTFGLYSIRAKKEGELFSPNGDEADAYESSSPYLLSTISISDLLEKVKDISIINEIFSKDVADKLNVTRSNGDLTNSRRYSLARNTPQQMRERMARERAESAKVEGAKVFAKKDVEIAVKSIEGWTQEEVLSLAKGQELQGMSRAKREEMISNKNQSLDYKNLLKKKKKCGKILLYNYILRRNANETVYG